VLRSMVPGRALLKEQEAEEAYFALHKRSLPAWAELLFSFFSSFAPGQFVAGKI
jgi:hypothetical protein